MTVLWIILTFLAGTAIGAAISEPVLRRHPILLWPSSWLPAIRSRRQRRKMTDRSGRIGS